MNKRIWMHKYAKKMNRALRKRLQQSFSPRRTTRRNTITIPVIIQFNQKVSTARVRALRKHLGSHAFRIRGRLPLINCVVSNVSLQCLKRMCAWKGIGKIYLDGIKRTTLHIATPSIGSTLVRRKKRLTGKGVNIAIIDTGVYPHPDLTRPVNRIVAFKDWVNHRKRPYDDNGHGTHIAGDAAGNGWMSKGKYSGPAPKAGIVGVKVLDKEGSGYDSTIIKGIEWCIAQRKRLRLRILSMSFGGTVGTSCRDDALCQAVEKAAKAGLIVVVAAGNNGPRRRTIETPGISPAAVTVGAVDDRRSLLQADDRITSYSSRGPTVGGGKKPDIVAPGETVISLRAPRSKLDREFPSMRVGKSYFTLSGTSVSTPIVSGAAAQLLQWHPALSPRQVKSLLKNNAFRLKLRANTAGSGVVNMRFLANNTKKR